MSSIRGEARVRCVEGLCVPVEPPPLLVFSEVYSGEARVRAGLGADLVVVGARDRGLVEEALESGVPVGVDSGLDLGFMEWALDVGAVLGMSLTREMLGRVPRRLREEKAFVIIPRSLGSAEDRVRELEAAYRDAIEMGYELPILDPVLEPLVMPGALAGFIAARGLRGLGAPIMLGINNAYELLDADTTGSIPVLASLAAEAGASIILVSEESRKALGATLEARIAADMASIALKWKTQPKDLGLSLLVFKEKRPGNW
ncbi:MAG: hypothetical protein F7C08_00830 [Desulfurococcales archaeon]|nr:hypothetical protein [Desulfurococcales archaeon]